MNVRELMVDFARGDATAEQVLEAVVDTEIDVPSTEESIVEATSGYATTQPDTWSDVVAYWPALNMQQRRALLEAKKKRFG